MRSNAEAMTKVVAALKAELPELPDEKHARFMAQYGLPSYDARVLILEQAAAEFYETVARGRDAKLAANYVMGDLFAAFNRTGTGIANSPIVSAHPSAFDLLKCSSCSSAALFISHSPSVTRI